MCVEIKALKPWVGKRFVLSCLSLNFILLCIPPPQGGIAFVAIKGAFKVYFKQQQYLRQAHRKILNFPEQEEAWGGPVGRPAGRTAYPPL